MTVMILSLRAAYGLMLGMVLVLFATVMVPRQALAFGFSDPPACKTAAQGNCSLVTKGTNDCQTAITKGKCLITDNLIIIINAMSALASIAIVGSLIWAGIKYSAAGGNAGEVAAARARIRNSIIALALFLFGYAFLQWLVPGGIF